MQTNQDKSRAVALGALILAILNPGITVCACGYMDWVSLPGNFIAFALSWGAFMLGKDRRPLTRVLIVVACVMASIVLLKNFADILWIGHEPLLK